MTTDWTPTEATAEPNKLVDADELSRAVAHVKEWFAAELAKLHTPDPVENYGTTDVVTREDITSPDVIVSDGTAEATSDEDVLQTETVDHQSDV